MFGIIITILLVPVFGAMGAGIGIFTASLLFNLVGMNIVYWRVLKLDIPRFFRECHLKLMIPLGLTLLAGFAIQYLYQADSLISFFPKVILLTLIYIVIMWLMGMNSFEKQLAMSVIKRIIPTRK